MRQVLKYTVTAAGVRVPEGNVLAVAWQRGEVCVWIEVSTHELYLVPTRRLRAIPTGIPFDETKLRFVGSALSDDLCFHIYEEK